MSAMIHCLWCDHTETGDGYASHDAMFDHQDTIHGRRNRLPCGCQMILNGGVTTAWHWWTCDKHTVPRIKQITAWQLATKDFNPSKPVKNQPSLFAEAEQ